MQRQLKERIGKRAYELFLERGGHYGNALDDWLKAEREMVASFMPKTGAPVQQKSASGTYKKKSKR